ncbi:hypothetical protein [Nonomuraea sp. NPDC050691]|uniref:hypothetical protein n=1 Tax=Nonomuraea sp. NPDC050691 TaxID=3155661 RepID=UPI0033ED23A8
MPASSRVVASTDGRRSCTTTSAAAGAFSARHAESVVRRPLDGGARTRHRAELDLG